MSTGAVLWTPSKEQADATRMAAFLRYLERERGLRFEDYNALWAWSIKDLEGFWSAIWSFFDIQAETPYSDILVNRAMPGAEWFPGARLNLAAHVLRHAETRPDRIALSVHSETFGEIRLSWADLADQVARAAAGLRAMGVEKGDRVVAILPNTETSIVSCLATLSIGAVWSLCAPDMGHVAIIDRFQQISPKVIIVQDGYIHGGKTVDRRPLLGQVRAALPSLAQVVWVPVMGDPPDGTTAWHDLVADPADLDITPVEFDHPLWVVYSSGTTGNPKPIVHGHGGVVLESSKQALHQNIGPEDRFCWLTSSGWIMWNTQLGAVGQGASVTVFDGAPNHPDMLTLWRLAETERLTYLGAGAAFFEACLKSGIRPGDHCNLDALRAIGATGSPLSAEGYGWIYDAVKSDVWLAPISGGTDICGAFVCGNPMLPVRAGEMQCRSLGNAVRAFDEQGNDLIGEVGELVCTEPLPSMPLCFWGDEDGARLRESYFETYPGVWTHGDWIEITETGGAIIYGRSDATINRKGLRIGTSEIYRAVEAMDEIQDSVVVDLEFLGRESHMPLFVVPAPGVSVDDGLKDRIAAAIRESLSPRFVPDEIVAIAEVPRTLSGKKLEVPVKKLLLGGAPDKVVNRDSMSNPQSFDTFVEFAAARALKNQGPINDG